MFEADERNEKITMRVSPQFQKSAQNRFQKLPNMLPISSKVKKQVKPMFIAANSCTTDTRTLRCHDANGDKLGKPRQKRKIYGCPKWRRMH